MTISRDTLNPYHVLRSRRPFLHKLDTIRSEDFLKDETLRDTITGALEDECSVFKADTWDECKNINLFRFFAEMEYLRGRSDEGAKVVFDTFSDTAFTLRVGDSGGITEWSIFLTKKEDHVYLALLCTVDKIRVQQDKDGRSQYVVPAKHIFCTNATLAFDDTKRWKVGSWECNYTNFETREAWSIKNIISDPQDPIRRRQLVEDRSEEISGILQKGLRFLGLDATLNNGNLETTNRVQCAFQILDKYSLREAFLRTPFASLEEDDLLAYYLKTRTFEVVKHENTQKLAKSINTIRFLHFVASLCEPPEDWRVVWNSCGTGLIVYRGTEVASIVFEPDPKEGEIHFCAFVTNRDGESLSLGVSINSEDRWTMKNACLTTKEGFHSIEWGSGFAMNLLPCTKSFKFLSEIFDTFAGLQTSYVEGMAFTHWRLFM